MERRTVFVQCLPKEENEESSFHKHQIAVRGDLVQKLRQRGVTVVDDFNTHPAPEVLVLFQSVGRIGDDLPSALPNLPKDMKDRVKAFTAIQDDENSTVGNLALPSDFRPEHLLDLVVVPGSHQLKICAKNDAVLNQIAQYASPGALMPEAEEQQPQARQPRPMSPATDNDEEPARKREKTEEATDPSRLDEGRTVFVQCLPKEENEESSFHKHQMAVRGDLVQKLRQRGVTVVDDFNTHPAPEVLVLFQSVGSIGYELPSALPDLPKDIKDRVKAFTAIQDDENSTVGNLALPSDFRPEHLLDLVVVPGSHQLKNCAKNDAVLNQIAQYASRGTVTPEMEKEG